MKSWTWSLSLGIGLSLAVTSCAYQGSVRYECQESKNWKLENCQAPKCKVVGTCPIDLVGKDIYESKP